MARTSWFNQKAKTETDYAYAQQFAPPDRIRSLLVSSGVPRRESLLENRLCIECDLHVITYNQSAAFQD